ncbi:MAG TPA: YraN family protein [Cytophagaceae bacterium]|jgi:putative endonuclease
MARHNVLGKEGEETAARYLQVNGYTICCRNYRYKRGEIDIIAEKNKTIVFVEVKLRSKRKFGNPEEFVSSQKVELIRATAENYIYETNWRGNIRFDIISINPGTECLQFEDAFC